MTVKPQMQSYIYAGLLLVIIVGIDCLLLLKFDMEGLWIAVVLTALIGIVTITFTLNYCRTLHFSEKGCTVSCLGLRKFTPWDKLVICQEERFKDTHSYPGGYAMKCADSGAVFSTSKKMRPRNVGISEFNFLRNPFTTFYVVYKEENEKFTLAEPHVVDREAFLAALEAFGIKLEKRYD